MSDLKAYTFEHECNIQEAKDLLGGLIANRSSWMYKEENKENPNHELIQKWLDESNVFDDRRSSFFSLNEKEIQAVMDEFTPQSVAENELNKKTNYHGY